MSEIAIQFDPFSFTVACGALLISWRAYYLSKKAPAQERLRNNRDAIRDMLTTLDDDLAPVETALRLGNPLDDPSPEVESKLKSLYARVWRVPEATQLIGVHTRLTACVHDWSSVRNAEKRVEMIRENIAYWEPQAVRTDVPEKAVAAARHHLSDARADYDRSVSERDAHRQTLRDSIKTARKQLDDYVNAVDTQDRNA